MIGSSGVSVLSLFWEIVSLVSLELLVVLYALDDLEVLGLEGVGWVLQLQQVLSEPPLSELLWDVRNDSWPFFS